MSRSNQCHQGSHAWCRWVSCLCGCHNQREPRSCPVCGEPPGEGFLTYCSREHMLSGVARGS